MITPNGSLIEVFVNRSGNITIKYEDKDRDDGGYFFLPPEDLSYLAEEVQKYQEFLKKIQK